MGGFSGRIVTRDFLTAAATQLVVSLVFFMLLVTMALYTVERFDASDSLAGFASSAFILGALLARPFAGRYLDVVGRRRLILVSLAAGVVASGMYLVVHGIGWLLALRLLHGATFAGAHTALTSVVMSALPPLRRAEGTGYYVTAANLATAGGPVLALALVGGYGYPALFTVAAALSVLALVLGSRLRVAPPPPAPPRARGWSPTHFVEPAVLPVASMMLLVGVALSGVLSFVTAFAAATDLQGAASAFFLVYSAIILVSRLFVGRIHDTRGDNTVVYPALAALTAGLVLLGSATTTAPFLLAGGLLGLGIGTLMSSVQVITVARTPPHRVGLATSTYYGCLDLGAGAGPLLLGLLIGLTGFSGMYLALAAVVLLAALTYHLNHGRASAAPS